MIRRPPRSTRKESSAASDVYKRQGRVSAIRFSLTYACAPVVSFVISIIYKVTVVDTSSLFVGFGIVIIILFLLANKITFSPLKKGDKSY